MNLLIVLAGEPPSKTLLKTEMTRADRVLAVDGGFNIFKKYQLKPDLVLGDLDSVNFKGIDPPESLHLADQEHTDLQKTLDYAFNTHSISSLVILGGGGMRTDHLINNLHICATLNPSVDVTFKNELPASSEFSLETIQRITVGTSRNLSVQRGDTVSILPITDYEGLTSAGLKWEITKQGNSVGFISQSNLVVDDELQMSLSSGCAYIAVYQ